MQSILRHRWIAPVLSLLILVTGMQASIAQAGMISTQQAIESKQSVHQYQKAELQQALAKESVRQQLLSMGVDVSAVDQRLASMTAEEIVHLNQIVDDEPAGGDVVGLLFTLFIVFVVTDMLCATDLFTFVRCINQ